MALYRWVFKEAGEGIADRFLLKLESAVMSLQYFPERGVLRDAIAPGARILIEGNYLILYEVVSDRVEVKRVVRGSIDLNRLFS